MKMLIIFVSMVYFVQAGDCYDDNCVSCPEFDCVQCKDGYTLNGNNCYENCYCKTGQGTKCTECYKTYTLDRVGICEIDP